MARRLLPLLIPVLVAAPPAAAQDLERGQQLYGKYCAQCHGVDGDGEGVAAPYVKPKPRDFRPGKFKIRSTPSGKIPTDQDLANIIRRGMPYTSMPAWPIFSDRQLTDIVAYIKTFSEALQNDPQPEPINIPAAPESTPESIERGAQIYVELGCAKCHGELGRGDGRSTPTLRDDWGHHLVPADLSKPWTFRGGAEREDVFRAFSTGLNGTPMPSYFDVLDESKRWDLVHFIFSLGTGAEPAYDQMVTALRISGDLDASDPELFAEAPESYFPIVGQITQAPREFHPTVNGIWARAVFNESVFAIELRWHDMRAETSGVNGPHLVVPPFGEDPFRGGMAAPAAAEEATASDDPFAGDEVDPFAEDEVDPFAEDEIDPFAEDEADPFAEDEGDFWGEGEADPNAGADPATVEFSDAVAVQLPLQLPTGNKKPYFIFGDAQLAVDLWFQDLAQDRPEQFVGRGSALLESLGRGDLDSAATYDKGEWRVVFTRELRPTQGIELEAGMFAPIAFSVWDGFNRERGNKRGLSQWMWLYLDPGDRPSAVGPMLRTAGIVLIIELVVVALVRRRFAGSLQPSRTQT